jgi:aminoglycoside phosphotransferase (APT) family kinase protein
MPSSVGFDPTTLRTGITTWLATRLPHGSTAVDVTGIDAPDATGHSSETVLFDAAWTDAEGTRRTDRLVLRTAPSGHTVFPVYDLGRQYRVMELVRDHSEVPLPPLRWYEADPTWIGSEFLVMGRVEGQVPPDRLPYTMDGWLLASSPEDQRRLQRSAVRALAAVHAVDWRSAGLDLLDQPRFGRTGLDQQLGEYRHFLAWGRGDHPHHFFHEVADWLQAHRPDPEPDPVLNWGDARIGNMVFRDHEPVAVLDWEMATLGPREVDLAWFCLFERFFSAELDVPNLPGFAPTEQVVADYCEDAGCEVGDLGWYTVWAAYRYALVFMRLCQAGHGEDYGFTEDDNLAVTTLRHVLDEVG